MCHDALDTSYEFSKLIRCSPKRNAALDRIKIENPAEEESGPSHGIRSFCSTRWTVGGDAIESILDNYEALKRLWDECLETNAKNPVWLGIDMLIYHWTLLAKNLNGAKRFDDYTAVIVSGNTKQRRCSFKYTMGR